MTSATDTTRVPLAIAEAVAAELVKLLEPFCERIQVAGSVRRRRPIVGDVEIVAVPRVADRPALFGPSPEPADLLDRELNRWLQVGHVAKRVTIKARSGSWGRLNKWAVYRGVPVDFFSCAASQWGVYLAIRTGPASFSKALVTPKDQGGLLPPGMRVRDWRLLAATRQLDTPEEEQVFEALDIPYVPPAERDTYLALRPPPTPIGRW